MTTVSRGSTVPAVPNPGWAGCVAAVDGFRPRTARQRTLLRTWRPLLERTPEVTARQSTVAHVTVSAVPVSADGAAVLLCRHPRFGRWGPWGGHVDPDDADVTAALVRELTEEAGDLDWQVTGMLDLMASEVRCLPDAVVPHLDLLFGVRVPVARPPSLDGEVALGRWCDPDRLPRPAVPRLRDLVARSRRAVAVGA